MGLISKVTAIQPIGFVFGAELIEQLNTYTYIDFSNTGKVEVMMLHRRQDLAKHIVLTVELEFNQVGDLPHVRDVDSIRTT